MDVPFPKEQIPVEPVQPHPVHIEVQVNLIPFPPTPHPEVSESEPMIKPHSYKSMKEFEYFRSTNIIKKKAIPKLPKNKPRSTAGVGKQLRSPIKAKPMRKGARNKIDNAISVRKRAPRKQLPQEESRNLATTNQGL